MTSVPATRRTGGRATGRRTAVIAAALGALVAVSACSSDSNDKPKAKTETSAGSDRSASPSAGGSSDPQAGDKKDVLGAYGQFWDAQVKAYAKADAKGTSLTKYATGDALSGVESDLMTLRKAGKILSGTPGHTAKVTSLDMDRKVPRAKINDCLDVTKWRTKDRKTGKTLPAPKGQLKRYISTADTEKWGKQWMIIRVSLQERAC